MFLGVIRGKMFDLLRNLLSFTNPKDKSFADIVEGHFKLKPIITFPVPQEKPSSRRIGCTVHRKTKEISKTLQFQNLCQQNGVDAEQGDRANDAIPYFCIIPLQLNHLWSYYQFCSNCLVLRYSLVTISIKIPRKYFGRLRQQCHRVYYNGRTSAKIRQNQCCGRANSDMV